MGLKITVAGATFTKSVAKRIPFAADALFSYEFGGTLADSLKNMIGGADGTQVGSLSIGPNYIGCDKGIGIESNLSYEDDFTYAGVINYAPGGTIMGYFTATGNYDVLAFQGSNYVMRGVANGNPANAADAPAAPNNGKYLFYALAKSGTAMSLYYQGGSGLVAINRTVAANLAATQSVKIGGAYSEAPLGRPHRLSMAACYRVGLNSVQVDALYAYMKQRSAERGVLVH